MNLIRFYADWSKLHLFVKTVQIHRALCSTYHGRKPYNDISIKIIKVFLQLPQPTHPTQKTVNTPRSVNAVKEKELVYQFEIR